MTDVPRPYRLARREDYLRHHAAQLDGIGTMIAALVAAGIVAPTPEWTRWLEIRQGIKDAHPKPEEA